MDQQGLRDVDRWKDKIEVRLDNRQVAFLFFGSALVACMLFILGVIVGKRLESRGRALAPEIEDPLALLDRVAATAPPPATPAPDEAEVPAPATRPAKTVKREPPPPAVAPAVVEDDPIEAPGPAERPAAPKPAEQQAVKPVEKLVEKPVAPIEVKSADILPPSFETKDAGKKPRFMLQIGSFPDKGEAEAYASGFAAERPIVVMSEIPGKGTWYRVRLGGFQAFKDAVDAKSVFERRYNKIALVVGPL
jgi:cell division protein FtsN